MVIKDGSVIEASDLLDKLLVNQFSNYMNLVWNSDYIGWNSKLNYNSGVSSLWNKLYWDNLVGSTTNGQIGVESSYQMTYDSTNDYYHTTDLSAIGSVYAVVTADSGSVSGYNCAVYNVPSTNYRIVYSTSGGSDEVQRAEILAVLFANNDIVNNFTNVTELALSTDFVSASGSGRDIGRRMHYVSGSTSSAGTQERTGVFSDTTTNQNVSSWSSVGGPSGNRWGRWQLPDDTTLNYTNSGSINEFGTDRTADENLASSSNPADCQAEWNGINNYNGFCQAIMMTSGSCTISWTSAAGAGTDIDWYADHSIPLFTAAGTLTSYGLYNSNIVFNDVATAVKSFVATWNTNVDVGSTATMYASSDNGSSWETVTKDNIHRFTGANLGSNFKFKWEVVRTDLSKLDRIMEIGCMYNIGAGSS